MTSTRRVVDTTSSTTTSDDDRPAIRRSLLRAPVNWQRPPTSQYVATSLTHSTLSFSHVPARSWPYIRKAQLCTLKLSRRPRPADSHVGSLFTQPSSTSAAFTAYQHVNRASYTPV